MPQISTLVIGGHGFIGQHITQRLAAENQPVVVLDRHTPPCSIAGTVSIQGELSDHEKLAEIFAQYAITHVIHLASSTLPKSSNENMPFDVSSNLLPTLNLLDLCVKHKARKVVFMSSGGTVYGPPQTEPMAETHPTDPICSYGIIKLAIEKYLQLYQHLFQLDYIAIRAANPYGPGQNPLGTQGVIANFAHKILTGLPLEVWGDGSIVRDYFYVQDLAELTYQALLAEQTGVFNAGSGTGVSLNTLIQILGQRCDLLPKVNYHDNRSLDVKNVVLDTSKARNLLGWKASTRLEEGIDRYIDWYRTSFRANPR